MTTDDVEQFLWEVETHLSDLPGDRRLEALNQVERDLHERARSFAARDGRSDPEWHDFVQATAEMGPPDALAAAVLGRPLRPRRGSRRAYLFAGTGALLLATVLVLAALGPNDLAETGRFGGSETGRTGSWNGTFQVAADAEAVAVELSFVPPGGRQAAHVYVFDGDTALVYEARATVANALQTTKFLRGAPGTWLVIVDFEDFTGTWRFVAYEAR